MLRISLRPPPDIGSATSLSLIVSIWQVWMIAACRLRLFPLQLSIRSLSLESLRVGSKTTLSSYRFTRRSKWQLDCHPPNRPRETRFQLPRLVEYIYLSILAAKILSSLDVLTNYVLFSTPSLMPLTSPFPTPKTFVDKFDSAFRRSRSSSNSSFVLPDQAPAFGTESIQCLCFLDPLPSLATCQPQQTHQHQPQQQQQQQQLQ